MSLLRGWKNTYLTLSDSQNPTKYKLFTNNSHPAEGDAYGCLLFTVDPQSYDYLFGLQYRYNPPVAYTSAVASVAANLISSNLNSIHIRRVFGFLSWHTSVGLELPEGSLDPEYISILSPPSPRSLSSSSSLLPQPFMTSLFTCSSDCISDSTSFPKHTHTHTLGDAEWVMTKGMQRCTHMRQSPVSYPGARTYTSFLSMKHWLNFCMAQTQTQVYLYICEELHWHNAFDHNHTIHI